jgi:tetratricopeptide (TPR) repeat protein
METRAAAMLEDAIDQALAGSDLGQAEALAARYRALASDAPLRWRAGYLAAQVALAAGRLGQAAQHLVGLLPPPEDLPGALRCRVWLLSAETLVRLHRSDEARHHLGRAQQFEESLRQNPRLRLRELRIRLWLGEWPNLMSLISECISTFSDEEDYANLALLFCAAAWACEGAGDLDQAEDYLRQAEGFSQRLGADSIRADVLIQLGRLKHLRGYLQGALDDYGAAEASGPAAPQRPDLHLRRLLVCLELNQHGAARAQWERALAGGTVDDLPDEVRGLAEMAGAVLHGTVSPEASAEVRAYQAARRGDAEEARRLYAEALKDAPAPTRHARLALALGMLALAAEDRQEAERWLAQAEEIARRRDLPEVLWRALVARGRVAAEFEGDEERARGLFEEAVLVSEEQARRLRHGIDAAAHHLHRAGVLRELLRSACRRGDAAAVFRCQELDRGRLLWELWQAAPRRPAAPAGSALAVVEDQLAAAEREIEARRGDGDADLLRRRQELLLRRDRLLDEYLRDRSRRGDTALPPLPGLADLQAALPADAVYVAPAFVEDELHLLAARRDGTPQVVKVAGPPALLREQLEGLRHCVAAQLGRYRRGFPVGPPERAELDGRLEEIGHGGLGNALGQILAGGRTRLVWTPDGELHGFPVHALRRGGRYLAEDQEISLTFGGALLVHQARTPHRRRGRALVVAEVPEVLPCAGREGEGVAATFFRGRLLQGAQATRAALQRHLPSAGVLHLACHAFFDLEHPLAACIRLPSGETWKALEWLDEPLAGLPLATLSACRSAEVGPLVGREVFGLVTGLLGSGVRAVVAGLWPVADREALPLMWNFYRRRMTHDLGTAFTLAQREALARPDSSPLFWAAFALFGDPLSLPAPPRWRRWWARRRQRQHAERFVLEANPQGACSCPTT